MAARLRADPAACAAVQWLGAAYLAGLAVGFWSGRDEIAANWQEAIRYEPAMEREEIARLAAGWDRAVKACREFTS